MTAYSEVFISIKQSHHARNARNHKVFITQKLFLLERLDHKVYDPDQDEDVGTFIDFLNQECTLDSGLDLHGCCRRLKEIQKKSYELSCQPSECNDVLSRYLGFFSRLKAI